MVAPAPGVFRDGCLVLVLHALLGDQQHDCCHHQAAADDIEQGGAHAAGAGQHSAAFVDNANQMVSTGYTRTILDGLTAKCSGCGGICGQGTLDDDFNGIGQRWQSSRSAYTQHSQQQSRL